MIDSFNFISEFCDLCFTKAPEKHHETLIENIIALLNVFLTATGTTTRSARSSTRSTRPPTSRASMPMSAPPLSPQI